MLDPTGAVNPPNLSSLHSHNTAYLALCLQATQAINDVLSDCLHVQKLKR